MDTKVILTRVVKPLLSRKVRVALVTVLGAYLADWGLNVSENMLWMGISVGVAVILGIAHEDAGLKGATTMEVTELKGTEATITEGPVYSPTPPPRADAAYPVTPPPPPPPF